MQATTGITEGRDTQLPLINVKVFDFRITDDSAAAPSEALTNGLCSVVEEDARQATWVMNEAVSPKRWGIGGVIGSPGPTTLTDR